MMPKTGGYVGRSDGIRVMRVESRENMEALSGGRRIPLGI